MRLSRAAQPLSARPLEQALRSLLLLCWFDPLPNLLDGRPIAQFAVVLPGIALDLTGKGVLGILNDLEVSAHAILYLLSVGIPMQHVGSSRRPEHLTGVLLM